MEAFRRPQKMAVGDMEGRGASYLHLFIFLAWTDLQAFAEDADPEEGCTGAACGEEYSTREKI